LIKRDQGSWKSLRLKVGSAVGRYAVGTAVDMTVNVAIKNEGS
jgi:hypothetical protein